MEDISGTYALKAMLDEKNKIVTMLFSKYGMADLINQCLRQNNIISYITEKDNFFYIKLKGEEYYNKFLELFSV